MITGSRGYVLRSSLSASRPSISGILMSRMTRSGLNWASLARAIRPLAAVPTTSSSGSRESSSDTRRRKTTESSTTRMRIFGMRYSPKTSRRSSFATRTSLVKGFMTYSLAPAFSARDLLALGFRRHHDDAHPVVRALGADLGG